MRNFVLNLKFSTAEEGEPKMNNSNTNPKAELTFESNVQSYGSVMGIVCKTDYRRENQPAIKNFNLLEEIKYAVVREYCKDCFDEQYIDDLSDYYDYVRLSDSENVMNFKEWLSERNQIVVELAAINDLVVSDDTWSMNSMHPPLLVV